MGIYENFEFYPDITDKNFHIRLQIGRLNGRHYKQTGYLLKYKFFRKMGPRSNISEDMLTSRSYVIVTISDTYSDGYSEYILPIKHAHENLIKWESIQPDS